MRLRTLVSCLLEIGNSLNNLGAQPEEPPAVGMVCFVLFNETSVCPVILSPSLHCMFVSLPRNATIKQTGRKLSRTQKHLRRRTISSLPSFVVSGSSRLPGENDDTRCNGFAMLESLPQFGFVKAYKGTQFRDRIYDFNLQLWMRFCCAVV